MPEQEPLKKEEANTPKKKFPVFVVLMVLICCNIAVLAVIQWQVSQKSLPPDTEILVEETISQDMQKISVNEGPRFTLPGGEGDLRIEIGSDCHYAYRITYSLAATQKKILETGLIQPGEYVLEKPLEAVLEPGEYAVMALFTAYNRETGQQAGQVAQALTFYVTETGETQ
ncbi:MAG: hypothetical protein RSC76_08315 [Oscillospiraceae bacterium]